MFILLYFLFFYTPPQVRSRDHRNWTYTIIFKSSNPIAFNRKSVSWFWFYKAHFDDLIGKFVIIYFQFFEFGKKVKKQIELIYFILWDNALNFRLLDFRLTWVRLWRKRSELGWELTKNMGWVKKWFMGIRWGRVLLFCASI